MTRIREGKEFKYLGTMLTEDNNIATEIKQLIIMANKTSYGLKKKLNSPNLKHQTKCTLYKNLIRPILTYGSKCRPLLKKLTYALNFCYTIQLMHYSHFKTQSLQHLKPIKC